MTGPTLNDAALEAQIELAALRLQTSPSVPARRAAWAELKELIGQRSPEQIQWMQERKGLAR